MKPMTNDAPTSNVASKGPKGLVRRPPASRMTGSSNGQRNQQPCQRKHACCCLHHLLTALGEQSSVPFIGPPSEVVDRRLSAVVVIGARASAGSGRRRMPNDGCGKW